MAAVKSNMFSEAETKFIELVLEPTIRGENGVFSCIATTWENIAQHEKKSVTQLKNEFANINEWVAYKVTGDKKNVNEIDEMRKTFAPIKEMYKWDRHGTGFESFKRFIEWVKYNEYKDDELGLYDEKDKEKWEANFDNGKYGEFGFGSFLAFCEWYFEQIEHGNQCYYCGTSEFILVDLFIPRSDLKREEKERKPLYSKKRSFTGHLQIERKDPYEGYNAKNCVLACAFCNNAKSDMVKNADDFKKFFAEPINRFLLSQYNHGKRFGQEWITLTIDE